MCLLKASLVVGKAHPCGLLLLRHGLVVRKLQQLFTIEYMYVPISISHTRFQRIVVSATYTTRRAAGNSVPTLAPESWMTSLSSVRRFAESLFVRR